MDNQSWDKAKLEDWKNFWESEIGQEAIARMQNLKEQCFTFAMNPADPNQVAYYVGRAGGIDLVLQDINSGFVALEELTKKEEKPQKSKK